MSGTLAVQWNQSGGGVRFHLEFCRAAVDSGVATAVSYVATSDQAQAMSELDVPAFVVKTYRTKVGVIAGLPRLLLNSLRLRRFLRREGITRVIGTMESLYQSVALPLILPRRIEYIVVIHDAVQHPGDEHILKRIGRRLELGRADRVVTLSGAVSELLKQQPQVPRSIQTLFHPVYGTDITAEPRTLPVERSAVVGTFGRLLPYKGIDLLVEALGELRTDGADVRGLIAGEGPEAALAKSAAGEPIDWEIGWIDQSAVDDVVQRFDILVLPYREASQSGVVAHAWCRGVPVVATPVGGLPEQVEGTGCGIVADAVTGPAVAAAVRSVLSDAGAYARMSLAGIVADAVTGAAVADAVRSVLSDADAYARMSLAGIEAAHALSWSAFVRHVDDFEPER